MKKKILITIVMLSIIANAFALSRKNIKKLTNSTSNFANIIENQIENRKSKGHHVYRKPVTYGMDWDEIDWCFWEYESGEGIYTISVPNDYGGNYIIFIQYDGDTIINTYTILEK